MDEQGPSRRIVTSIDTDTLDELVKSQVKKNQDKEHTSTLTKANSRSRSKSLLSGLAFKKLDISKIAPTKN